MPPTSSATNIRVERPRGWRAHRQGRESTGNGGPGNRPSERPISNRGRTATPQAAASQGAQRVARCSQQPSQIQIERPHFSALTHFQVPGRSPDWLKMKNPACEAVTWEEEEDWAR